MDCERQHCSIHSFIQQVVIERLVNAELGAKEKEINKMDKNSCFLELSYWEEQTDHKQGHNQIDLMVSENEEGCEVKKQGERIEDGGGDGAI